MTEELTAVTTQVLTSSTTVITTQQSTAGQTTGRPGFAPQQQLSASSAPIANWLPRTAEAVTLAQLLDAEDHNGRSSVCVRVFFRWCQAGSSFTGGSAASLGQAVHKEVDFKENDLTVQLLWLLSALLQSCH